MAAASSLASSARGDRSLPTEDAAALKSSFGELAALDEFDAADVKAEAALRPRSICAARSLKDSRAETDIPPRPSPRAARALNPQP